MKWRLMGGVGRFKKNNKLKKNLYAGSILEGEVWLKSGPG